MVHLGVMVRSCTPKQSAQRAGVMGELEGGSGSVDILAVKMTWVRQLTRHGSMEKGIRLGQIWFPKKEMCAREVNALVEQSIIPDNTYPPWGCRDRLRHAYGRYCVGNAAPIEGQGLFLRHTDPGMAAGELVGIYAGKIREEHTEYSLDIGGGRVIDGTPVSEDPMWYMGRINDWIWDEAGQNCRILQGGVIVTTKWIKPGDQFFMSYTDNYNWGPQKWRIIQELWANLRHLLRLWGITDYATELEELEWRTADAAAYVDRQQCLGDLAAVVEVFMNGVPEEAQHRYEPRPCRNEPFANWVERVLRSREWINCFGFGKRRPNVAADWTWVTAERAQECRNPRAAHNPPVVEHAGHVRMYELSHAAAAATTGRYTKGSASSWAVTTGARRRRRTAESARKQGIDESANQDVTSTVMGQGGLPLHRVCHGGMSHGDVVSVIGDTGEQSVARSLADALSHDSPGAAGSGGNDVGREYGLPRGDAVGSQEDTVEDAPDSVVAGISTTFRMMAYNVGGLNELQCSDVVSLVTDRKLDFVVLIDVRMTAYAITALRRNLQERLGSIYCTAGKGLAKAGRGCVGGQILIYRLDICVGLKMVQEDAFGGLVWSDFRVGLTELRVISVYWPLKNVHEGTLWQSLGGDECIPQLKSIAKARTEQAVQGGRAVIYVGDFNCDLQKHDRYQLAEHLCDCLFTHSAADLMADSFIGNGASRIDHVVHRGVNILTHAARPVRLRELQTDHLPMCAIFRVVGCARKAAPLRQELPRDVDMRNKPQVAKIVLAYANIVINEGSAEDQLCQVAKESVEIVRRLQKHRRTWRNGWSPTMVALQFALRSMVQCRRRIRSVSASHRWTPANFATNRYELFRSWARCLRKIAWKKVDTATAHLELWLGDPRFHWVALRKVAWVDFEKELDVHIVKARHQLQGRMRRRLRLQMHQAVALREERRISGRLKAVLSSILGPYAKRRTKFSMEYIKGDDGSVQTDPETNHAMVTDTFRAWFRTPPEIRLQSIGHIMASANVMTVPIDEFVATQRADGVPDHILRSIWRAGQIKHAPIVELGSPPSWEDFNGSIDSSKLNSAAGISGLSYNMIRLWPEELRRGVYKILIGLWEHRLTPGQWKLCWLVPIPKVEDPKMTELRPLMLLDGLRKLWLRSWVLKVQRVWRELQLLQVNQHGCVPGRGTDTATVEITHGVETMKEFKSSGFISSFDKKRAFDSVSKPLCRHALIRLGIPADVAAYIIGMDEGGLVVVRSPLALQKVSKGGSIESLGFAAERGAGQGDVSSPMVWTAVYDMLLCALAEVHGGELVTRDRHGVCKGTPDVAYADDLISIQGTIDALQQKADVVSGFCITCGLSLAVNKFRAFGINWGNEWTGQEAKICIHTHGWERVEVALVTDGILKHLGRCWDMHLSNKTELNQLKQYCGNALEYVSRRLASAETKLLAIKLCILPKVVYVAKFMGWTLATFHELETKFSVCYRRITKNLASFPTALLYASVDCGGLGLPSFVDACQKAKLILAMRMLGSCDTRHSMSGMLARGIEYTGNPVRVNTRARAVGGNWTDSCWSRSLIEWTGRAGIFLVAEGCQVSDGELSNAEAALLQDRAFSEQQFFTMMAQGEATVNDLQAVEDGEELTVMLRVGQCWTTTRLGERGYMLEILVLNERTVDFMAWHSDGRALAPGVTVRCEQCEFPRGAGPGQSRAEAHVLFVERLNREGGIQVKTTGDRHSKRDGVHNLAEVICLYRRTVRGPGVVSTKINSAWDANTMIAVTHGREALRHIAKCAGKFNDSLGTLVVQFNSSSIVYSQIEGDTLSGDQTEQMSAIVAGMGIGDYSISVKSKKLAAELQRVGRGDGLKESRNWNLLALCGHTKLVRVRCRRTGGPSKDTHGAFAIDTMADSVDQSASQLTDVELMRWDLVQEIIRSRLEFSWEDAGNRLIFNVAEEVDRVSVMIYCRDRDQTRVKRGRAARWADVTSVLAADMWELRSQTVGTRARRCRIIWDKQWTGENQWKAGSKTPDLCQHCGTVSGQHHMVAECKHPSIVQVRNSAEREFVTACRQFAAGSTCAKVLGIIRVLMRDPEASSIWTGMWTVRIREMFESQGGHDAVLTKSEYRRVVKALRILADAVDKMVTVEQAASGLNISLVGMMREKRPLGAQRTLEECGWVGKKRRDDVDKSDKQIHQDAAHIAVGSRVLRHMPRHIREDDSSQFDVGRDIA